MTISVGFTGTQQGMTDAQRFSVYTILQAYAAMSNGDLRFHHGDCVGADEQAHALARSLGYLVYLHPPVNESKRAFCEDVFYTFPPLEYLDRNKEIVHETRTLIAAPKERDEQLRSGTWSTVRYAEKHYTDTLLVMPEGDVIIRPFKRSL